VSENKKKQSPSGNFPKGGSVVYVSTPEVDISNELAELLNQIKASSVIDPDPKKNEPDFFVPTPAPTSQKSSRLKR
jgi:hypothetical protein